MSTPIESALARLEAARKTLAAAVEAHQWALFRQDKGVGNPHECSVASLASQDAQAEYNALLRNAAPALLAVARAAAECDEWQNAEDGPAEWHAEWGKRVERLRLALSALAAAVGEGGA